MEITSFFSNLHLKDGIWFSNNRREISYPSEGNKNCYEIEKDSFWFKHRNNCILEVVKIFSQKEIFFDIGGGNGYVAKALEENGIETILIEPGIEGALNAKQRGLKHIVCSTFEEAGIQANSCPSIGLFDVVEHIEDDRQFLKSIYTILREGGILYLTVPAYNFLWSKEDEYAGHFRRYSLRQICSTLASCDFRIEYASYIFSFLPIPIFFFRTIPGLLIRHRKSINIEKHKKEHSQRKGILSLVINMIMKTELHFIKRKKKIPFGGSCFVVAKK
jgi:SAM-dependent methyltransferase